MKAVILDQVERDPAEYDNEAVRSAVGQDAVTSVEVLRVGTASDSGTARAVAAAEYLRESGCALVIGMSSVDTNDVAAGVAARLGWTFAADCSKVDLARDSLSVTRPAYGGRFRAVTSVPVPAVLTLRVDAGRAVRELDGYEALRVVTLEAGDVPATLMAASSLREPGGRPPLVDAPVVVSGGRGMGSPENWHLLENLADKLGAGLGATRAVTDAGWRPHVEQVGQTGTTVSPQAYLAFGISGAVQHLAGMASSGWILAVNTDASAPIFDVADMGIVGDAVEFLPHLMDALNEGARSSRMCGSTVLDDER